MRRLAALLVAGFMVLSTFAVGSFMPVTHATEIWCEDDPIVHINGVTVNINVGVRSSAAGHITGPIQVTVIVPEGAKTSGAGTFPADFSSNGIHITGTVHVQFVEQGDGHGHGDNHVTVLARVPGDATSFGTRLSSSQSDRTDVSTSNHTMSIGFSLGDGQHGQHGN